MPEQSNNPFNFWQELKRRKVIRVIAMYAASGFILLEVVDIITPALHLPSWTVTLVIVLLAIGFPIVAILSWIFDITPEGLKKTESSEIVREREVAQPRRRRLRISDIIIGVLLAAVMILVYPKIFKKDKFEDIQDEAGKISIAVMPFKNISPDSTNQYILDGIMEAVLNYLTNLENIRAISSTSVQQYRETIKTTSQIGKELNVSYLLEGSGQKYDENFRLTTKLLNAKNDELLWSNPYDRELNDILAVQSEIAREIVSELQFELSVKDLEHLNKKPTYSTKAYTNYLRAEKLSILNPNKAIELLNEAIEIDSQFVEAYVYLSRIQRNRATAMRGNLTSKEALQLALPPINKALEINPNHADAHVQLGMIRYWLEWDFIGAENEFLRATEINGVSSSTGVSLLIQHKRFKEALSLAIKIKDHNPLGAYYVTGLSYLFLGEHEKALKEFYELAEMVQRPGTAWIGRIYMAMQDYYQAITFFEDFLENNRIPFFLSDLAICYHITGKKEETNEILDELIERYSQGEQGSIAFMVGRIYSGMGNVELALEWLEKSYQDHELEMIWLYADPQFKPLKDNEQYIDLLKRVGFDV